MRNYNKIIIGLTLFTLIASPILAQGNRSGDAGMRGNQGDVVILGKGGAKNCEAITQIYSKIEQRLTQREGQLSGKQGDIGNRYQERKQRREENLEQRRAKWDENRQEHFAKLYERAIDDEKKQAVTEFVEIITNAVKDRRGAFDQAILDFQDGLDSIHQGRLGILADAVADYKEGVKAAFDEAEQGCSDGLDIMTIRENLMEDLKDVRDQYREDVRSFKSHGEEIQELIEAKKEAMNNAKDEFKETLEQALEDLKVNFPEVGDEGEQEEEE